MLSEFVKPDSFMLRCKLFGFEDGAFRDGEEED
jgi:hypothetical protein